MPPPPSSAGVPTRSTVPGSASRCRASARKAPSAPPAMRLCPHACPISGSASYSARMATRGPRAALPMRARNAVGRPPKPRSTATPGAPRRPRRARPRRGAPRSGAPGARGSRARRRGARARERRRRRGCGSDPGAPWRAEHTPGRRTQPAGVEQARWSRARSALLLLAASLSLACEPTPEPDRIRQTIAEHKPPHIEPAYEVPALGAPEPRAPASSAVPSPPPPRAPERVAIEERGDGDAPRHRGLHQRRARRGGPAGELRQGGRRDPQARRADDHLARRQRGVAHQRRRRQERGGRQPRDARGDREERVDEPALRGRLRHHLRGDARALEVRPGSRRRRSPREPPSRPRASSSISARSRSTTTRAR